jgi:aminoglycoside phosphotransferase (APT) family kinase protein
MKYNAPEVVDVITVAEKYIEQVIRVERIPKGSSTYVYRAVTNTESYYLRFLPEDGSFATEVFIHRTLSEAGISVPQIIGWEHKNELTGLSVMIEDEVPGISVEDERPKLNLQEIMRDAGRQLAHIHSITVDGFGWINKDYSDVLKGEKADFDEYFSEFLRSDLNTLHQYPFLKTERIRITELMIKAQEVLRVEQAVLVHGDFDISHIFHSAGRYSGIIDFGEVRGNNRLFDLATFTGFYQDRRLYSYLLDGYREIAYLSEKDLYAVELMALFIILRLLGKKVNTVSREHWYQLAMRQLSRIDEITC